MNNNIKAREKMNNNYDSMADEKLIEIIRKGNVDVTDYLIEKYKYLVKQKARFLYLYDGDNDDLIQEGMIGIFKAIRDYDFSKDASFRTFVDICIDRQMYDAIRKSNRKKNTPLNSYISFYDSGNEIDRDEEFCVDKLAVCKDLNPEKILIEKEHINRVLKKINERFSLFEKEVFRLYIEGMNYTEIAASMDKSEKSIDNALQRIKTKINEIKADVNN